MQGGPLSPDEYRVASPPALLHQPAPVIVVAIDRDRNSQLAAKWVVDHLLSGASQIVLLHVAAHYPANHGFAMAETTQSALEAEMKEIFVPYRGFFNRNGVSGCLRGSVGRGRRVQGHSRLHHCKQDPEHCARRSQQKCI
ncbi:Protein kinase protein with adenine nucleotide alpha hydrolase-like domain, partial [Zea mays]